MTRLRKSARWYAIAVMAAAVASVVALIADGPARFGAATAILVPFGALFGSRAIQIGSRINLCIAQPFIFAAMLIDGPLSATAVALVATLGSALITKGRTRPFQVLFNVGAVTLSTVLTWWVFDAFAGGAPADGLPLERSVPAVLVASVAYFLINTWTVIAVIALDSRSSFLRLWLDKVLWSLASYVMGGVLGLLVSAFHHRLGATVVLLLAPFCYFIYYSYRLYADRLEAEQKRIAEVERHNQELERRVRERTESLEASNRQLAEANRLKSAFLANTSHELRTPLNAIIGFSQLLKNDAFGALSAEQNEVADDILSSGRSLLQLINDLLDLSKIEAGKMKIHVEACEPSRIVREAASLVEVLAAKKSIRIALALPEDERTLVADAIKLKQVLWNLLSNAIKFTPEGGAVEVSLHGAGDRLTFAVTDTGIGIPGYELDRIFDPFYQVDGSHSRQHGGTGLGLGLARKFVEMHGGTIRVESTVGVGSRFEFEVPAAGPPQFDEDPLASADASLAAAPAGASGS